VPNRSLPLDIELFEKMFHLGIPYSRMANVLGFTTQQIQSWAVYHGYRKNKYAPHRQPERKVTYVNDPTPEQMRERILEVQSRWSADQRESRRVTKTRRWTPPLAELQG
jgi:uncharacterized protein YjcR